MASGADVAPGVDHHRERCERGAAEQGRHRDDGPRGGPHGQALELPGRQAQQVVGQQGGDQCRGPHDHQPVAHEQQGEDAAKVLAALARPNTPRLGDRSSPEDIRDAVGLSKKAFKRAVGHLLKNREVDVDDDGIVRRCDTNRRPAG